MNKKVVKNLYSKTASVLNESLVKDTAALLGVEEGDVAGAIDGLSFADYLQLGNAVDIGDADTVREMLDISGVDSMEVDDELSFDEEPVEEAWNRSVFGRMADENKARLKKEREEERARKKAEKAEWNRKYGTPKKVSKKALYGEFADKILSAISNSFPDGDPMDYFINYMQRNNLTMDDAEKAMKQATGRSYDHYLIDMWDSFAADSAYDANGSISRGQDPGDSPFWTWDGKSPKVELEPNPWGTYKKRGKRTESVDEGYGCHDAGPGCHGTDDDDWDWEDDERNEQVTQYYEAMDGSVFLDPDFKGISSLEVEEMYKAADMAVRKKARSKGQSHPEVKELYKKEVKLLNEISWRTVYAEKQIYGEDWKGEEYDASWSDDDDLKESVDYDQHYAPAQVVKVEPGKGLGRKKIYIKLLKGKFAGRLASFANTLADYAHPTYSWHNELRPGDKVTLSLTDLGYYVLPQRRDAVTEADNPSVTPPSQGFASSSNLNQKDSESNLVKRKDVDDLMFGDEVEVADVDGQPAPAKVIMPRGPGNTVVVKGKGGNEVILKKDSILGTPKVNESWGDGQYQDRLYKHAEAAIAKNIEPMKYAKYLYSKRGWGDKTNLEVEEIARDLLDTVRYIPSGKSYYKKYKNSIPSDGDETGSFVFEEGQINEISLKTKTNAYVNTRDPGFDYYADGTRNPERKMGQGDRLYASIAKKHGEKAARDAERAAVKTHYGEDLPEEKIDEESSLLGWRIEDKSRLGGGADPTWITRWELKSGGEHLEVEEIFGDWYITDQKIGGRSGALTYGQANQYLADYGAPTMDRIEAFLEYMHGSYGDAENGPSPRDLGEGQDSINEVSLKTKINAYVANKERGKFYRGMLNTTADRHDDRAERLHSKIVDKHGSEAGANALKAADAESTRDRVSTDPLKQRQLRGTHMDGVTSLSGVYTVSDGPRKGKLYKKRIADIKAQIKSAEHKTPLLPDTDSLLRKAGIAVNKIKQRFREEIEDADDAKFDAQKQYDYHTSQYERLMKSQGWHGGASGTEVYNRDWKKEAANHKREAAKYKKQAGINEGVYKINPADFVNHPSKAVRYYAKGAVKELSKLKKPSDDLMSIRKIDYDHYMRELKAELKNYAQDQKQKGSSRFNETASGGATGAGAIATAPMGSKPTPKSRKKNNAERKKK